MNTKAYDPNNTIKDLVFIPPRFKIILENLILEKLKNNDELLRNKRLIHSSIRHQSLITRSELKELERQIKELEDQVPLFRSLMNVITQRQYFDKDLYQLAPLE